MGRLIAYQDPLAAQISPHLPEVLRDDKERPLILRIDRARALRVRDLRAHEEHVHRLIRAVAVGDAVGVWTAIAIRVAAGVNVTVAVTVGAEVADAPY